MNIDNPKEESHVMIHFLGTHEIPAKACGTASVHPGEAEDGFQAVQEEEVPFEEGSLIWIR